MGEDVVERGRLKLGGGDDGDTVAKAGGAGEGGHTTGGDGGIGEEVGDMMGDDGEKELLCLLVFAVFWTTFRTFAIVVHLVYC